HRVLAWTLVLLLIVALPRIASAVPSFARQTGMPCSQCHTLSFGPALTPYGRQFKLNGYTFGEGEHPMPLAFMVQGGFSHTDVAPPADAQPAHFAPTTTRLSTRSRYSWRRASPSTSACFRSPPTVAKTGISAGTTPTFVTRGR